jgi:flagella basal body P-ring formation protein FlgA
MSPKSRPDARHFAPSGLRPAGTMRSVPSLHCLPTAALLPWQRRDPLLRGLARLAWRLMLAGWLLVLAVSALVGVPAQAQSQAQAQAPVSATDAQPLQALTQLAMAQHPGLRVQVQVGALDNRLALAPCQRIEPRWPAGLRAWGRVKVPVRCVEGPVRWQVYLPLQVQVWAQRPVAAQALAAGTVLQASHLALADVDLAAEAAAPLAAELLPGRVLARGLPAGSALRPADLRQRQWFAAGDTVRVVAQGEGFAISADAVALTAGLEGQPSRARTEQGRVIVGRAVGDKRLEVDL